MTYIPLIYITNCRNLTVFVGQTVLPLSIIYDQLRIRHSATVGELCNRNEMVVKGALTQSDVFFQVEVISLMGAGLCLSGHQK